MKAFLLALQFLTVFPVNIKSKVKEEDLSHSLAYFPLVGTFIGIILYGVVFIFGHGPGSVLAAVLIISHILITGALHLDGFADT
ncbi:MAG: adenosylcobinamide-GDP ribazoletransferase, partial [Candidatus Heimdallarchaeota archaeon]|nr:adenosylcobinamide-GDP ribazoletransferase [Candidatus Heimdallarchaeota archaeon]